MRRRRLLATLAAGATPGVQPAAGTGRTRLNPVHTGDWWEHQDAGGLVGQTQIAPDRTRMTITLRADGSAGWQLAFWTRLDTEDAESAFQSLEDDVETDPATVLDQFRSRMTETVAAAADATGREMTAGSFAVTTETRAIPQQYGLLVYEFVWEGFAVADDTTLRAGDAIDGLLLASGTRLTIRWPDRFKRQSVDPAPDEAGTAVVAWNGTDTDFVSSQPRVVVSTETASGSGDHWPLIGGGVLGTLGLVGVFWWARRRGATLDPFGTSETPPPATVEEQQPVTADSETAADQASDTASNTPPDELLSNEERVLQLLEQNGGRIKQQQVVAELDWTEAKTSQVVTSLREENRIEVFRIGRENVLALPEESSI